MSDVPNDPAARRGFLRECGLVAPQPRSRAWWIDPHMTAALLAAVPVWLVLRSGGLAHLHAPRGLQAWLVFALLRPALEEVVFRGLLQGQLLRLTVQRRVGPLPLTQANLAVSAAFAAAHLPVQPIGWALATFVPSLVMGHLRDRFGSVLPCVVLHIVYNAGFGLAALSVHG